MTVEDDILSSINRSEPLLEISGLRTWFFTADGIVKAVDGVDLTVDPGEVVGLVGESGSGKSVTSFSILRLVSPPGRIDRRLDPLRRRGDAAPSPRPRCATSAATRSA